MQVAFHLGAHFTDPAALLRSLRHDEAALAREGIALPGPAVYLPLLMQATEGDPTLASNLPQRLQSSIGLSRGVDRLVLSGEDLLGRPARAVVGGRLYPAAAERVQMLAALFPGERIEFHMAIRSPATFLPSLLRCADPERVRLVLQDVDLTGLRWSELVARMREAAPDAPITIWCDEDMPLIWPEALAAVAGLSGAPPVAGLADRLAPLLTEEGARRMTSYLNANPAAEAETRRVAITGLLNQFARREAIEMELDLPGWTPATIDRLSDLYEEDIERIDRMDGVHLIAP